MNGAMVLAAAAGRGERRLMLVAYAVFALLALAFALAPTPLAERAAIQLGLVALPTLFLWMGWFSRLLVLQAQARATRIPGMAAFTGWTLLATAGVTILLPGYLISFSGMAPGLAVGALACAAALALGMALLPRGLAGLAGFVPMAIGPLVDRLDGTFDLARVVPAVAIALALLVAWRWLRIERRLEDWQETTWQQPVVFAMARRGGFFGGRDLLDARAQSATMPRWLRRVDDVAALGPGRPRTLRALLGGIFTPVGWRQRLVLGACYLGVLWLFWRHSVRSDDAPWQMLMFAGLLSGGMLLLGPFALRLQALQQEHGGEMAELALLPGWGDAASARRSLLEAVGGVYRNWCLVLFALMAVGAMMTGEAGVFALAMLATAALCVLGVAVWLRTLAGHRLRLNAWIVLPILLLGTPLLGLTIAGFDGAVSVAPLQATWAGLLAWGAVLGARAWRRFQQRPHPFLLY